VLEIGGGWGAFVEHAGRRGIQVTTLTLAEESERYLTNFIAANDLPATVVRRHVLEYQTSQRYDGIVNMGVTEHLPNYKATLRKVRRAGQTGRSGLSRRARHAGETSRLTFMSRYIYPGESSPLLLHAYLRQVARSPFELVSVDDDRHNYYLTCREWARRLDEARDEVVHRWGDPLYRRFRIFLWGRRPASTPVSCRPTAGCCACHYCLIPAVPALPERLGPSRTASARLT